MREHMENNTEALWKVCAKATALLRDMDSLGGIGKAGMRCKRGWLGVRSGTIADDEYTGGGPIRDAIDAEFRPVVRLSQEICIELLSTLQCRFERAIRWRRLFVSSLSAWVAAQAGLR